MKKCDALYLFSTFYPAHPLDIYCDAERKRLHQKIHEKDQCKYAAEYTVQPLIVGKAFKVNKKANGYQKPQDKRKNTSGYDLP